MPVSLTSKRRLIMCSYVWREGLIYKLLKQGDGGPFGLCKICMQTLKLLNVNSAGVTC